MTKGHSILILPATKSSEQIIAQSLHHYSLTKGRFSSIRFHFTNKSFRMLHENRDLSTFDSVWLSSHWNSRDIAYAIHHYLSHHNINCTYVEPSTSKITDQSIFVINGLTTPDTLFAPSLTYSNLIPEIEDNCGYPLIIKESKGSQGKRSLFIQNRVELNAAISKLSRKKRYVFQKYIHNEFEWGILVSHGKVVSAEKSYPSEGEFRNNVCNGAKEVFVPLSEVPQNIHDLALKACKSLGLSWARADILIEKSTGIPYLLEVNRFPGITENSSEVTGALNFLEALTISPPIKVKRRSRLQVTLRHQ